MTKASSPCHNVAFCGSGKCDSSGLETTGGEKGLVQNRGSHSQLTNTGHPHGATHLDGTMTTPRPPRSKAERIQEGLERTISQDAKERIDSILKDANELSDVQKLLLYLKLPTGSASDYVKDSNVITSTNRLEQIQAVAWINSHLEEHAETSLPKQDVFDDYKMYCDSHGFKFLSQADFGKVMKCAFPNVKPRRLGQRGQSKHCYGGLRKRLTIHSPQLPPLSVKTTQSEEDEDEDEVLTASCRVVCEWAQKLLNQPFTGVRELAQYLVNSLYVNSRSVSAFTILAAMHRSEAQTTSTTSSVTSTAASNSSSSATNSGGVVTSGNRHRETQLHLARKLQQKELLREHKRKMDGAPTPMEHSPSAVPMEVPASVPETMPAEKPHKATVPITPQKLILPKCTSTPPASTGTVVHSQAPTASGSTAGHAHQSILVISPTPHIKPPSLSSVVILSPVTQQRTSRAVIPPVSRAQSLGLTEVRATHPGMLRQHSTPATAILAQPAATQVRTLAQALAQVTPTTAVTLPVTALGQPLSTSHTPVFTQVVRNPPVSQSAPVTVSCRPSVVNPAAGSMVRTLLTSGPSAATTTTSSSAFVPFEDAVVSQASQPPMPKSLEAALTASLDDSSVKIEPAGEMAALNISSNSNDSLTMNNDSNDSSAATTPALLSPSSGFTPDCKRDRCSGARNKIYSKTVSSLLKEQRGYGPLGDQNAPYVNDRRPVATLLRESRQRRGSGGQPIIISPDSATSTPIMSPQTVLPCNPPALQPRPNPGGPLLVTQPNNASQMITVQQPSTVNLVPGSSTNLSDLKTLLQASNKPAAPKQQLEADVNVMSMERDALQDFFGSTDLQDLTRMIESGEVDNLSDIPSGAVVSQPASHGTTLLLDQVNATLRAQLTNNNSSVNFSSPPTIKRLLSSKSSLASQSRSLVPGQNTPVQLTLSSQQPMLAMALQQSSTNQLTGHQQYIGQQQGAQIFNDTHQQNLSIAGSDNPTPAQHLMWLAQQSTAAGKKLQPNQLMQLANLSQHNVLQTHAPALQTASPDLMHLPAELRQAALFRPVTHQDGSSMPPSPAVQPGSGMVSPANSMPASPLVICSNSNSMPPSPMMSPQQSGFVQAAGSQSSLSSVGLSGLTIRERLAQKLRVPDTKRDNTQFAPASSIRPVKRGCRSSKLGNSKRQRHHSAHSALGCAKAQMKPLLAPNLHQQMAALQHNDLSIDPQHHLANSDNTLNMAAPQSPFSPEMADIFGSTACVPQPSNSMFRSQSVPVADMFCSDSDNQELFAMASSLLDQQDLLSNGATNELATLLQEKLEPPSQPDNRGLHINSEDYTAKRNLNDILEFQSVAQSGLGADLQDNSSLLRFTRKGDMTLTSASLYGHAGMMADMTQHTPPASQTTTPDYSQDMTSGTVIALQPMTSSGNHILTHTPSSLDALSGQDSRESMQEPLFGSIYDSHPSDMGADMTSHTNTMDIITNNDFSFGQWEMPQIAQDGI